jgi:hypothetical protein
MNLKSSTDLWFSAFLLLKGIKVEKFEIISRGKGRYFFKISDEDWSSLKLEFNNNNDLIRFKTAIEQLKDLLY